MLVGLIVCVFCAGTGDPISRRVRRKTIFAYLKNAGVVEMEAGWHVGVMTRITAAQFLIEPSRVKHRSY
jgi:hypothetical protein